ncbi:MAG TPA: serine hydrolase [Candidatus Aminicenantes bacterium]|nr:serine hydrolase [Candidatus Aminicenantes bacterium]
MTRTTRIFVFLLIVFLPLCAQESDSLCGHWQGEIQLPGIALEIQVSLEKNPQGEWKGSITIPLQQAKDIPLEKFAIDGDSVRFAISGVPGEPVFFGTLENEGSRIEGTFTQGGQEFSFQMHRADDPLVMARKALKGFDEVINQGLESLSVPGVAMAVVRDDALVFAGGYGLRDLENKLPMTADTLLAIGSSSKAFTTFALGVLTDRGRMEWDQPVREYIPWFQLIDPVVTERLTPRDLVTHRSGMPRHDLVWYNNKTATREELVRKMAHLELSRDLRQEFQYNNLMFLTAGYLLETLTGSSWESSIRDLVFSPLDMKRSNFSVLESQKDNDFAWPYRERDGKLEKIPFRDITTVGPAGSINSSVNEMSRWLMVHLSNGKYDGKAIVNPATLADTHRSHMPTGNDSSDPRISATDYGMGWFVDHYRGHRRVHHGGNIDGFSCMVVLLPDDGLGFVAIANKNAASLPELLIRTAADRLLDLEPVDWIADAAKRKKEQAGEVKNAQEKKAKRRIADTRLSHKLKGYLGTYHHPGYGDLVVSRRGKKLQFTYNGIETALDHWHYDTFNGREIDDPTFADMKLTFQTDANGFIYRVSALFEPMTGPILFDKQPHARYHDPEFLKTLTGDYTLMGQKVTIDLKGEVLTIRAANQPASELVPALGDEFFLKDVKMIRLKFILDETGNPTAIEIYQPQGTFTAEKLGTVLVNM